VDLSPQLTTMHHNNGGAVRAVVLDTVNTNAAHERPYQLLFIGAIGSFWRRGQSFPIVLIVLASPVDCKR
jgi:hypothetical protein